MGASPQKGDQVMAEVTKRTIIESGTEIEGVIKSENAIVLCGNVTGQVTASSLEVTKSGAVKGTVKVSTFHCEGEVGGEVDAEQVELSGRVCDATVIRSKSLDVKLAQGNGAMGVTFGNCELQVGELPVKTKAKPAATTTESSKPAMSSKPAATEPSKSAPAAQRVDADVVDIVSELMK
jgi:cytoskeletal protein CcmA (bactofilin family)